VRPLRLQEKELTYLTDDQIEALFAAICLATGARWGEAQALTPDKKSWAIPP
jgi:integrase